MQLRIDPDGTIHGIYADALLDLLPGRLAVERASNVEFNADTQRWEARLAMSIGPHDAGWLIASAPSRAEALRKEVEYLNQNL